MLYDPKWEQPDRKYQGVSLRGLIAWLETMPPEGKYEYVLVYNCAAAQYLQSRGVPKNKSAVDLKGACYPSHPAYWLDNIVNGTGEGGDTFGAALERAREELNARC